MARFVGVENILEARVIETADAVTVLAIGDRKLHAAEPAVAAAGHSVCVGIRAEQVTINPAHTQQSASPAVNRFDGRITSLRSLNPLVTVEIDCGFPLKGYLLAPQARAMNIEAGRLIAVEIAADAVHVMSN